MALLANEPSVETELVKRIARDIYVLSRISPTGTEFALQIPVDLPVRKTMRVEVKFRIVEEG